MMKQALFLSCVLMAVSDVASAQAPPVPATPPAQTARPAPANNCAPMQPVPPHGTAAPEGTTTGQRAEPLADKLARSDGVLCPPAGVDPEIRAPTPDTRQYTGDSAARESRRRSQRAAEIATPAVAR
jgi:hypothetical protein